MQQGAVALLSLLSVLVIGSIARGIAGPTLVKDVYPGSGGGSSGSPIVVGDSTYFFVGNGNDGAGSELWKSDGTAAGTTLVKDINPGGSASTPDFMTAIGSNVFFQANNGTNGAELWKSDGTAAGTTLVKDINSGSGSSIPQRLTAVGSNLFFRAIDSNVTGNGNELWKSDGTAAGTVLVKDINPGNLGSNPDDLVVIGSTLFFTADDGTNGVELWMSNGTAAGTVMVKDIRTGSASSAPDDLVVVGSTLFFSADDGTNGAELWKSDGTAAGTVMVKDIRTGSATSSILNPVALGSLLLFAATDGSSGYELWKSDGTTAGTVMVKDIHPGSSSGGPVYSAGITVMGSSAFFTGTTATDGPSLWKSDGTAAGTQLVKDIHPSSTNPSIGYSTVVNSTLFFSADDGTNGAELWKSDGTEAGTVMVTDLRPGSTGSTPTGLAKLGSTLLFIATDGVKGRELWRSDGTVGTTTTTTVSPSISDSTPLLDAGTTTSTTESTTTTSLPRSACPFKATPGSTSTKIEFSKPDLLSGSNDIDYSVDGGRTWTRVSTLKSGSGCASFRISGLEPGQKYSLDLRLTSTDGTHQEIGSSEFTTISQLPETGNGSLSIIAIIMMLVGATFLVTRRRNLPTT